MHVFEGENPNSIYKGALKKLLEYGKEVAPRGKLTRELQPAVHVINDSRNRLCSVPGRQANPFFNMAENMWILSGSSDSDWICSFNNKLFEYQGDEGFKTFNAAYGQRIRNFYNSVYRDTSMFTNLKYVDQLEHCYLSLKADPDTRQAVVSLWHPFLDNVSVKTKDRPCNITLTFKIRNGKLNMTVFNRSNDIHLGLYGVNFVQFGCIQEFLAATLGVGIGPYTHISDSLHVYDDSPVTARIVNSTYDFDVYSFCKGITLPQIEFDDISKIANLVVDGSTKYRNKEKVDYVDSYTIGAIRYLIAYDFQKDHKYNDALDMLHVAFACGFADYVVLALEFISRKKDIDISVYERIKDLAKKMFPDPIEFKYVWRFITEH